MAVKDGYSSRNDPMRAVLESKDLYCLLLDMQNGMSAPGHAAMANAALLKIDAARKAMRTTPSEKKGPTPLMVDTFDGPEPAVAVGVSMIRALRNRGYLRPDHACRECAPHGENVIDGFRCYYHQAIALQSPDEI